MILWSKQLSQDFCTAIYILPSNSKIQMMIDHEKRCYRKKEDDNSFSLIFKIHDFKYEIIPE